MVSLGGLAELPVHLCGKTLILSCLKVMTRHRVKVRIIGYHPWDNNELPENELPWAEVLSNPQTGGGVATRGETMNLIGGETAVGFFMDGEEAQQPVIFGLLHKGGNVEPTVRETDAISKGLSFGTWDPPGPPTTQPVPETESVSKGNTGKVKPARKDGSLLYWWKNSRTTFW